MNGRPVGSRGTNGTGERDLRLLCASVCVYVSVDRVLYIYTIYIYIRRAGCYIYIYIYTYIHISGLGSLEIAALCVLTVL